VFKQEEETGRIKNFELASPQEKGDFCSNYPFDDSDVYKAIEAASYSLMLHPDPELVKYLDKIISKIAAAQEKDGYIYTARAIKDKGGKIPFKDWVASKRWENEESSHELYNLGHLYEAAVAHYQATGKKNLLKIALKSAELILKEFGPGKLMVPPGHQEIEIGLVKLYRLTGEKIISTRRNFSSINVAIARVINYMVFIHRIIYRSPSKLRRLAMRSGLPICIQPWLMWRP